MQNRGLVFGAGILLALAGAAIAPFSLASAQEDPRIAQAAQHAKACEGGNAEACYQRGRLAYMFPNRRSEQLRYYERACAADHADACFGAAEIWETGPDRNPDKAKYRELMRKACSLGNRAGCGSYAMMAAYGREGPVGYADAKWAFDKSCALSRGTPFESCDGDKLIAEAKSRAEDRERLLARAAALPASDPPKTAKIDTTITEDMYAPDTGRRSNARDTSRSGYTDCIKSDGSGGQRYWYYGFDNKRIEGPCL